MIGFLSLARPNWYTTGMGAGRESGHECIELCHNIVGRVAWRPGRTGPIKIPRALVVTLSIVLSGVGLLFGRCPHFLE